jgi:hypothetical protein
MAEEMTVFIIIVSFALLLLLLYILSFFLSIRELGYFEDCMENDQTNIHYNIIYLR